MAGRWQIGGDGVIRPKKGWESTNSTPAPTMHGITQGQPPAGFVHHGPKRADRPDEGQIRQLMLEDDKLAKKDMSTKTVVEEAKEELRVGKMRIDPDIFSQTHGVLPHASVEDAQGRTHVVRADKLPPPSPIVMPSMPSPEAPRGPLVTAPREAVPLDNPITFKQKINQGWQAIGSSDGSSHRKRTF